MSGEKVLLNLEEIRKILPETAELIKTVVKELEEYKRLEEQDLLLQLPIKVGDIVYYHETKIEKVKNKKVTTDYVNKGIVDQILLGDAMKPVFRVCDDSNIWTEFEIYDFDKIVFLTRETAEAALENQ